MKEVMVVPEYSQVQTYLKCDRENFTNIIKHFSKVLSDLNLPNDYFKSDFTWEVADDGFVYVGGGPEEHLLLVEDSLLHIRPYIMGWTPEVINDLDTSWIELSILFWTEEIELDIDTGLLREKFKPYIWSVLNKFSNEFNQTGTFFTNETTDGKPWEAIVEDDREWLLSFDAAIIPKELINKFMDLNLDIFFAKQEINQLFISRKRVWGEEPWEMTR